MKLNDSYPTALTELRLARRQQRARLVVWGAVSACAAGLVLAPHAAVLVLAWALLVGFCTLMASGRPCAGCGRWGQHTLMCPRRGTGRLA